MPFTSTALDQPFAIYNWKLFIPLLFRSLSSAFSHSNRLAGERRHEHTNLILQLFLQSYLRDTLTSLYKHFLVSELNAFLKRLSKPDPNHRELDAAAPCVITPSKLSSVTAETRNYTFYLHNSPICLLCWEASSKLKVTFRSCSGSTGRFRCFCSSERLRPVTWSSSVLEQPLTGSIFLNNCVR